MKIFLENYNGVLDGIEDFLIETDRITANPHEADAFLLWQDIRGQIGYLAEIVKHHLKKPLIVMQHGRGAVRDYGSVNKFNLLADKILVWGESEKNRLLNYGVSKDRIEIVGCPHFPRLENDRKRLEKEIQKRQGKNILFAPVISQKEEPENLLVYAALKKWESEKLINNLTTNFEKFKQCWAWQHDDIREVKLPDGSSEKRLWKREVRPYLPRWATYQYGLVNVKLTGVHDPFQYQCPMVNTNQGSPNLLDDIIELLSNVDILVGLEEGTLQLMAAKLDIPCLTVDIFRYRSYGDRDNYDNIEKIRTKSCYYTKDLNKIGAIIDHALANPSELSKQRKIVCELEGGVNVIPQEEYNANVIGIIESCLERGIPSERIAQAA